MVALYIILGITVFFGLLLSVPFHVSFTYADYIYLSMRWLFVKLKVLPAEDKEKKPKKEKKAKKEKEEKPKEEAPKSEEKGENPIVTTLKAQGYDGVMQILSNLGKALGGMFKRIFKSMKIENLNIELTVGKGDAAATALAYGNACKKVFPVCGLICSTMKVKTYNVEITPDFLANRNNGELDVDFYIVPRKLINATIIVAFEIVFKVVLKLLFNKQTKNEESNQSSASEKAA